MQVLRELLPPRTPEWKLYMTGFSIVGQIRFYVQNRPVIDVLVGEENQTHFDADAIADHITEFSLAALGQRSRAKKDHRKPKSECR